MLGFCLGFAACLLALVGFEVALRALLPGVHVRSRYLYAGLTFACSPAFWALAKQASVSLGALGAMLLAIAFFARAMDSGYWRWVLAFWVVGVGAVSLWWVLAFVLAPLGLVLLFEYPQRHWVFVALTASVVIGSVLCSASITACDRAATLDWSVHYFWIKPEGMPNAALLWRPFGHPFFCLPLPALVLLFKKTDVGLYHRRALVFCLTALMLYFSGLHRLSSAQLLPAYALVLLLLFPAWDRFFAYGNYFFPRLTVLLMGVATLCQVAACLFFHG